MDPFERPSGSDRPRLRSGEVISPPGVRLVNPRLRGAPAYSACEAVTAFLICCMIVFTPWAFGTTQNWSIWTMNITGLVLGAILLIKRWIRAQTGFQPARWDVESETDDAELFYVSRVRPDPLTRTVAVLTVLVLGYTLIAALNARATYLPAQRRLEYRDCLLWLPHSYDSSSTWQAFWTYLGLAGFFWSARDWLMGKTAAERKSTPGSTPAFAAPLWETSQAAREPLSGPGQVEFSLPPAAPVAVAGVELSARLRLLLWVLCLNGSIVALEAILQRLSGTNKLLWLVVPRFNDIATTQFGPYAYRANAASYFNLIWPVCIGFWLLLRRSAKTSARSVYRLGSGSYLVLLPGAVLMAACPIISTNRGGALIAVASILVTMSILLWAARKESGWFRLGTCSLFAVIVAFAAVLGWNQLVPRFQTLFTDQMSRRAEIHLNALPIARDFPVFGTGPGTFGSVYHLYRTDVHQDWAAYVHDDWLETRITFGWLGFGMILLMLGFVAVRWFFGSGIPAPIEFTAVVWTALAGGLLHAKFDFPGQIYSIVFLLLLHCAVLFCLSRPTSLLR